MKHYLNKFHEELNKDKDKKISLHYIIKHYFYLDRVYILDEDYILENLLGDEEDVIDLYLTSIINNVESVEFLEKDKLKEIVKKIYKFFFFGCKFG